MRIPFISKKKAAPSAEQPRQYDGRFAVKEPDRLEKRVESEQKALSGTVEVMNSIYGIMEKQEAIMNAKVEAVLASGYEPEGSESDGLLAILVPVLEQLAPYAAPYIGPLLEKYAGVSPNHTSAVGMTPTIPSVSPAGSGSPPPAGGMDFKQLVAQAADSNPTLIKAAMPVINSKLKEQGIEPELFKQAILNLSKAVK